jgi:hypothetical protein
MVVQVYQHSAHTDNCRQSASQFKKELGASDCDHVHVVVLFDGQCQEVGGGHLCVRERCSWRRKGRRIARHAFGDAEFVHVPQIWIKPATEITY